MKIKILQQSLSLLFATLLPKLVFFLLNVFLARYLSVQNYGQYALVRSTINMLDNSISSSMYPLVIKEVSSSSQEEKQKVVSNVFFIILIFFLIVCFFLYLNASKISLYLIGEVNPDIIIVSIFLLFFTILNGYLTSILVSYEKLKIITRISLISASLTCILIFLIWTIGGDVSITIGLSILLFFAFIDSISKFLYLFRMKALMVFKSFCIWFDISFVARFVLASIPMILASFVNAWVFWFIRKLESVTEGGFEIVAYFDVSFQYILISMLFLNSLSTIILSKMSSLSSVNKNNKYPSGNYLFIAFSFSFAISIVSIIIIHMFSTYLMQLFGTGYDAEHLDLLSFVLIFYGFALIFNRMCVSLGKNWILLIVSLISGIGMIFYYTKNRELNQLAIFDSFIAYYLVSCLVFIFFAIYYYYRGDNEKALRNI
ncbi:oligosaccharide flippase family protein [Shewanella sp. FJAT-51649]|uniref:oligosaccharide flippase family protein n=1 Tax=Shewanella sp. FJAT-51649 TaxID=2864210 RepID=UPI001C661772|nr:oligosaccharide flippase family protein [Shewanella sp. FJAT-51649]QYJ72797.1 oligosaccharide flippase family protein [Shewanella sp. FJAT-51649]